MLIRLITINDMHNYGNRLQNYAVQKILEKNNVKAITLKNNPTLNLKNKFALRIVKFILKYWRRIRPLPGRNVSVSLMLAPIHTHWMDGSFDSPKPLRLLQLVHVWFFELFFLMDTQLQASFTRQKAHTQPHCYHIASCLQF